MTALTILYAIAFYAAILVLIIGIGRKIRQYMRVPAPLKIPVTPAPMTKMGVAWRLTTEIVFFNSLFRSTKWTWIFGYLFHFDMLLVLMRHLRYFTERFPFVCHGLSLRRTAPPPARSPPALPPATPASSRPPS